MSHKDGRVILSAWVDPALRDYARGAARASGLEFSRWVERAVQQTMARESARRAVVAAAERGECMACGHCPWLYLRAVRLASDATDWGQP